MLDKILFLVLGVGGIWVTWGLWNERQVYSEVENWPTVIAEVVKLEDFEEDWETKYGSEYKVYMVEVDYRYTVDGNHYTGNSLSASGEQMRWSSSEKMLADIVPNFYDFGKSVKVAYHPKKPATSIAIICDRSLEAQPAHSWIAILMSGGFSAFCCLMFIGSLMQPPIEQLEEDYIQSLQPNS